MVELPVPANRLYQGASRHHGGEDQGGRLIHCEVAGPNRGVGPGNLQRCHYAPKLKQCLHLEHNLGKNIIKI